MLYRPIPNNFTVYDRDADKIDTGLIAPNGQKIVKTWTPDPIGFVHFPLPRREEETVEDKSPPVPVLPSDLAGCDGEDGVDGGG